jgi:hypothetical protein
MIDLNDAMSTIYNLTTTAFQAGASSDASPSTWQLALQSLCAIVSVCTMSIGTCLIYKCRKTLKESMHGNNNNNAQDTMPTIIYDPNTGQYMCPPASSHISLPIIASNVPMPAMVSQTIPIKKKKQQNDEPSPTKKHRKKRKIHHSIHP